MAKKMGLTIEERKQAADVVANLQERLYDHTTSFFYDHPTTSGYGGTGIFRSGRTNQQTQLWKVSRESVDEELKYGELEELRVRSRQLCKDSPIAEGVVLTHIGMTIGKGPTIRCATQQIQDIVDLWSKSCDISGEKSIVDLCDECVSQCCENGDVLVTLPMVNGTESGIATVVQLIEADRINNPQGFESRPIRHGVEYSLNGRIKGYWVQKMSQLNNQQQYLSMSRASNNYIFMDRVKGGRLSAWLIKRPGITRPGQSRQLPLMSSCIQVFNDMDNLMEAVVVGSRVAACLMGVITSKDVEGVIQGLTTDPSDGSQQTNRASNRVSYWEPGMIWPLKEGEQWQTVAPERNEMGAMALLKELSKYIAMKMRIPYPILFLDIAEVNYSSYRGGIIECRKWFSRWRKWMTDKFLHPVLSTVIKEAWLKGMIDGKTLTNEMLYPKITWPEWGTINPEQEMAAVRAALSLNLTSPQRAGSEYGVDAMEILDERIAFARAQKDKEAQAGVILAVEEAPEKKAAHITPEEERKREEGKQ